MKRNVVMMWAMVCCAIGSLLCGCKTQSELCENSYSEFCARLYSGAVVDLDEWEKWVQMGRTELLPDEIVCDKRVSTVLRIAIVEKYGSSCMTVGGFPLHKFAWPLFYGLLSRSSGPRNFD